MAGDLSARDVERAKFAFSIYDFDGNETMDAYYVGDALRALNLNPTLEQIEKVGGLKARKQKYLKADEFVPMFAEIKNQKEAGGYDDFMECLKLYDKQENGMCLFAELRHVLLSLGERMEEKQVDALLAELLTEEEDEDGFVPYQPFLKRLVAGPPTKSEA